MVLIEIFGGGCESCARLESKVISAVERLRIEADIFVIENYKTQLIRGVASTPALAVDRKIVINGRVPTVEEIMILINDRTK